MTDLRKSLGKSLASALSVRDKLGLSKAEVNLLTKSWDGKKPGEGGCTESRTEMHPSPTIKDYGHDLRIVEAGAIRQGDLLLKHLDRKLSREQILNQTDRASVESYWEIDGRLYKAVKEKDEIFYWSVQVRPTSGG